MDEGQSNMRGEGPWILRLKDGFGRSLMCRLPDGSYRVGSALDCDIVLIDDQLDCAHVLTLMEDHITVEDCRSGSQAAPAKSAATEPDGEEDSEIGSPPVRSHITNDGQAATISADDYTIEISFDDSYVMLPAQKKAVNMNIAPVLRRAVSMVASMMLIGLSGSLILSNFWGPEGVATEPDTSFPAVNSLVQELGLQPTEPLTRTENGAWHLQQALWLPGEKDRLVTRARQTGLSLKLDGPEYEHVRQSLISLGRGFGVELTVNASGRSLEIMGLVLNDKIRAQLLATIARDMPTLKSLQPPRLLTLEEAALLLSASLRSTSGSDSISVVPKNGQIWVLLRTSALSDAAQRMLTLFRDQYGETAVAIKNIDQIFADRGTINIWENKLRYAFVANDKVVVRTIGPGITKNEDQSVLLDMALDAGEPWHDD